MTKVALLVELKAKLGQERELANFLTAQQSMAAVEPGMLAWFFVRLDAQTFALFDVFNEDTGSPVAVIRARTAIPPAARLILRGSIDDESGGDSPYASC